MRLRVQAELLYFPHPILKPSGMINVGSLPDPSGWSLKWSSFFFGCSLSLSISKRKYRGGKMGLLRDAFPAAPPGVEDNVELSSSF